MNSLVRLVHRAIVALMSLPRSSALYASRTSTPDTDMLSFVELFDSGTYHKGVATGHPLALSNACTRT
ncbi:MAG: hypothetical protein JF606_24660 [Burkholderiales bacterium]|nr:hypothetical protein [Burkholderiales bacterium]